MSEKTDPPPLADSMAAEWAQSWADELGRPAAPGTAPGGGAQEAATPLALADELDAVVAEQRAAAEKYRLGSADRDWALAEAGGIAYAAGQVRDRLAPEWEAANRAGLARVLAGRARYKAERDAAREELADVRERAEFYEAERNRHRVTAEEYRTTIAAVADVIAKYEAETLNSFAAMEAIENLFCADPDDGDGA